MRYVTIKMIAAHTGRGVRTVSRAMKRAGVAVQPRPGVHGLRIPLKTAESFIALQWPEVGPMAAKEPQP